MANQTLGDLRLRDEGVVVLGTSRPSGEYLGAPRFDTEIRPGDTLLVYGTEPRLCELDDRRAGPAGDAAHESAVHLHRADGAGSTDQAESSSAATSATRLA